MAEHSEKPYSGEYPDVHDEAANSPRWLPVLGFAILCVMGLFMAYRAATAHDEANATTEAAEAAEPAVEAAAGAEPAAAPGGNEQKPDE